MQAANEEALWKSFPTGAELDLTDTPEATVRADVLRQLLCGAQQAEAGHIAAVRLRGARIVGHLDLDSAEILTPLILTRCRLPQGATFAEARTRSLYFDECEINGLVLRSALVDGRLSLRHAHLTTPDEVALLGDHMGVEDNVRFDDARFDGGLSLVSARISKSLVASHADIQPSGAVALSAFGLAVGHNVFVDDGFRATGQVNIANSTIGGNLSLNGANLHVPEDVALRLDGTTIAHDVSLSDGFHATGHVNIAYVDIGGSLSLNDATLQCPKTTALCLDGATIAHDASLASEFRAMGAVSMMGTQVGQDLRIIEAHLSNPSGHCLNAHSLHVGKNFKLSWSTFDGEVWLIEATTTQLDDSHFDWPVVINLNGFTYSTLFPHSGAKRRLTTFLSKQRHTRAQPFEQLAQVYRNLGYEVEARRVLQAKERALTRQQPRWRGTPRRVLDALVGYGHFPARALWWVLGALVLGSLVFLLIPPVAAPTTANSAPTPAFNSVVYTLDVLLPAPKLGVEQRWAPTGATLVLSVVLKLLGWILSLAVVASLTRLLSRK